MVRVHSFFSVSLKSGVALLPLAIAFSQMPASAQTKTRAQLEAEAAAAKAGAQSGADADDAAAAAALFGGLTGSSKTTENTKDIVVTGTQIRGVAPTGTNLTVVSKDDIEATGQTSVEQLLATIPGFSNFNALPNNAGAAAQGTLGTSVRPNLAGTPDGDLGSAGLGDPGSATLILFDGNRQSGGGIRSVATDPDSISPALIERVEVNTDGASSSYGSDAIGGVVNFVTKKRFDGVQVTGRLGYADNYWQYDATALAGKDWGSGSAYVSGNYAYNTPLYAKDRPYLTPVTLADGLQTGLNCDGVTFAGSGANISIASVGASTSGTTFIPAIPVHYYKLNADGSIARTGDVIVNGVRTVAGTTVPAGGQSTSAPAVGLPANTINGSGNATINGAGSLPVNPLPNLCTLGNLQTRFNKNERYGVSGNFYQKITDHIDFLARANYAYVSTYAINAPLPVNINVSANNPFRKDLTSGANGTGTVQATYPFAQPGFTTPLNDAVRPCIAAVNGVPNPVAPCQFDGQAVLATGTPVPVVQTVLTDLSPVYGVKDVYAHNWTKKFGGNAEVNWHIDDNWLFKVTGVYDRTTTKVQYGDATFGGTSFLNQYQDGTNGGVCNNAIIAFTNAGGIAAADVASDPRNAAAVAARTAAQQVCLNPYNIAASNPAILAKARNFDSKSLGHDALQDYKFNLDGALLTIPGGKVRIAVGGEYEIDSFEDWNYSVGTPVPFSTVHDPFTPAADPTLNPTGFNPSQHLAGSRWIASVYGEINVPLVSRANELTWVKEFRLSLSARYDKYKIFGSSFNPKIGFNFKPTNWIAFRGNYNTSFRAPNILLSVAAQGNQVLINAASGGAVPTTGTNPLIDPSQVILEYGSGARTNLKPQTGDQWSLGIDLTPFRGFRASVTYSYINYKNELSQPNPLVLATLRGSSAALANYGLGSGLTGQGCTENDFVVVLDSRTVPCTTAEINAGKNPQVALTPAQVATVLANFLSGADNAAAILADPRVAAPGGIYSLLDGRYTNSGNAKIANLEYKMSYNSRTPWGSVFFSVNGQMALIRKNQTSDTTPFSPNGPFSLTTPGSKNALTAQAGFSYGPLKSSITLTHNDGYKVPRSLTSPQDRVGDFNLFNLFATWDFKGDNVIEKGLQLSLSINNVLNTNPPVRYTGTTVSNITVGTANGATLGRLIQLGFTKKF